VIKPIVKTKKGLSGGLEDMGDFQEGFCFKVFANSPDAETWIICVDDLMEKAKWINEITSVKGKYT